ncbi:MAG: DUF4846 domain-containing protein [Flavobacteriales bacterium]
MLIAYALCCGPSIIVRPEQSGTVQKRFPAPDGSSRIPLASGSFGAWLRAYPLLPEGSHILLFNGTRKVRQDVHAAVLDLSVGNKDLQQCADAVIRLRAEFLLAQGRPSEIHFTFTNGFEARFDRWAAGDRIRVEGNTCTWRSRSAAPDNSHASLMRYLEQVFMYAGTRSLEKELLPLTPDRAVQPGDVMIHGGSPGHAMMVMDVAVHADGRTFVLLAQSYMPAQQMHIVRNTAAPALGAWFQWNKGAGLRTPEWEFEWRERRRWPGT